MAPRKRYDLKTVKYRAPHEDAVRLSVREVMENDGAYCGPEFGWVTLKEMAEVGRGIDTGDEDWDALDRVTLLAGMVEYWDAHPDMAEGVGDFADGDYDDPHTISIRY